jgi:hypothetical protein
MLSSETSVLTYLHCVITQNIKIRLLTNLKTFKLHPYLNRPYLHNGDEKRTWVVRNCTHAILLTYLTELSPS